VRKSILLVSTFVATFLLEGLTAHVYGTEIDACYKTKSGKLTPLSSFSVSTSWMTKRFPSTQLRSREAIHLST